MCGRISEGHVAIACKGNALCILVVLGFLQKASTANVVLKRAMAMRHEGWGKRLGNKVKMTMACVTSGRQCITFP